MRTRTTSCEGGRPGQERRVVPFDGSDLLPGTLGQDFGTLLQNIIKNPNNVDSLLDDYQAEAEKAFS